MGGEVAEEVVEAAGAVVEAGQGPVQSAFVLLRKSAQTT